MGRTCWGIARQTAQQHLVDGTKEALNTAAPPWHPSFGEHQLHFESGTHLLQMVGGEITAMVRVKRRRNATDIPPRDGLAPDRLAQHRRRWDRGGRMKTHPKSRNGSAIVIHNDGRSISSSLELVTVCMGDPVSASMKPSIFT